jgi:metastasis suppressor protein 1
LFLDAFQRIADLATNTKGATREIGTALTRLILRHKAIEQKFKSITNALVETFIQPLNERIEDWKKSAHTLDKDHVKGLKGKRRKRPNPFRCASIEQDYCFTLDYKKLRNDLRKKAAETVKLQKKCRKCKFNKLCLLSFIHINSMMSFDYR